ncbi:MAG TPA: M20/M25/M40 family metallo-hydrolase, partial [Cytophagaceae bacterium]
TNASIRTTTASTIINGGTKENILPTKATAIINMRLLPGDTVEKAIEHIKKSVKDNTIKVSALPYGYNATPVSPTNTKQFELMQKTIKEIFPSALSAPYLVLGTTDARFYTALSKNVYRFLPVHIDKDDLNRIHGKDERVSIENYKQLIRFYIQFIKNFNK